MVVVLICRHLENFFLDDCRGNLINKSQPFVVYIAFKSQKKDDIVKLVANAMVAFF